MHHEHQPREESAFPRKFVWIFPSLFTAQYYSAAAAANLYNGSTLLAAAAAAAAACQSVQSTGLALHAMSAASHLTQMSGSMK
jgi:hypothetical protein